MYISKIYDINWLSNILYYSAYCQGRFFCPEIGFYVNIFMGIIVDILIYGLSIILLINIFSKIKNGIIFIIISSKNRKKKHLNNTKKEYHFHHSHPYRHPIKRKHRKIKNKVGKRK